MKQETARLAWSVVHVAYGALAFAGAARGRFVAAVCCGWILAFAALVQWLVFRAHVYGPWSLALAIEAGCALAVYIAMKRLPKLADTFVKTSGIVSLVASIAMGCTFVFLVADPQLCWQRGVLLSAIWFVMSFARRSGVIFRAGQLAFTGTLLAAATSVFEGQPWAFLYESVYLHPIVVQAYAGILAGLAMCFLVLRLVLRNSNREGGPLGLLRGFLDEGGGQVDRLLAGFSLVGMLWMVLYATALGQTTFHDPLGGQFQQHSDWATFCLGWGSLASLFAAIFYLVLSLWDEWKVRRIVFLFFAGIGVLVWLINAVCEHEAVSQNLRWGFSVYGLIVSAIVWNRRRVATIVDRFKLPGFDEREDDTGKPMEILVYALGAFVVLFGVSTWENIGWLQACGPIAIVAGIVFGYGVRERGHLRILSASILTNVAVSSAWISAAPVINEEWAIRFLQTNLIAVGAFGILWRWVESRVGGSL